MPISNERDLMECVVRLSEDVERWKETPADPLLAEGLRSSSLELADRLLGLGRLESTEPVVAAVLELSVSLARSGFLDTPASEKTRAWLSDKEAGSWSTRLACLLVAPHWQWPFRLDYDRLPTWLWGAVTRIALQVPQGFCAEAQAERYVEAHLQLHRQICRLAKANPGSASVKAVLQEYLAGTNMIPVYFSVRNLRELYELRGTILTIACGASRQDPLFPLPRFGRRLRVGFVNRHFGPQTETYTTIPTFEQLDASLFEVILFTCRRGGSALEAYAEQHCSRMELLPEDLSSQLEMLRSAALDVVVFGTNVTATFNEITRLALHRVAPLQVVNNSSCTTTGLPQIDLYVSGALTEVADGASQFSERLALLPGAAHAFAYEVDKEESQLEPSRSALGIPEDCVVFGSGANYFKIIPEVRESWARILAAVPGSRLLLHPFNPNWTSDYPIKRFCAEFDVVLAKHGVSSDRLIVSANKFPSRTDVVKLLSVSDVYLDSYPFGGVNSLVDALESGVPTLVQEGDSFRSRMGAALMRELGMDRFITRDQASYESMAIRLASNATERAAIKSELLQSMARRPRFLDTLASSQDFGTLLESAFDELCLVGSSEAFKANRSPLRVPMPAPHTTAEHREAARSEGLLGNVEREVAHLLAAVESSEADGETWFELSQALKRKGMASQAIQALETSIRLSPRNLEAWLCLAETAEGLGALDMAREAIQLARQIDALDSRLSDIAIRLGV